MVTFYLNEKEYGMIRDILVHEGYRTKDIAFNTARFVKTSPKGGKAFKYGVEFEVYQDKDNGGDRVGDYFITVWVFKRNIQGQYMSGTIRHHEFNGDQIYIRTITEFLQVYAEVTKKYFQYPSHGDIK